MSTGDHLPGKVRIKGESGKCDIIREITRSWKVV